MTLSDSKSRKTPKQLARREMGLQILLPLGIALLLLILVAVLVTMNVSPGNANIHQWANISVILLSVPLFFTTIVGLALLILLIFGQAKLINWLPIQLHKVRAFILKIALFIWRATEKMTRPLITVRSKIHGLKSGIKS